MKLQGKVAIVTGAGGGLGYEIALALASEGARLVLVDINWLNARKTAQAVKDQGGTAMVLRADITRERDVQRLTQRALDRFGAIDILVNNAGIGFGRGDGWGAVKDLTAKEWRHVLEVNLTGAFLCSKGVIPAMTGQKSGSIINISSGMGKKGNANFAAYSASKFGIEALTQVLAQELAADGVRVNALAPGDRLATPPVLARVGDARGITHPSVIRSAIVYLASGDSASVSGQSVSAMTWNAEHGIDNSQFKPRG